MHKEHDILAAFDIAQEKYSQKETQETPYVETSATLQDNETLQMDEILSSLESINTTVKTSQPVVKVQPSWFIARTKKSFIFIMKYITTSACIFGFLLVGTNYSAYWNLAYSIIYAEEMQMTETSLINSVAAASISEQDSDERIWNTQTFKQLDTLQDVSIETTQSIHSMSQLVNNKPQIDLGIEITPYENRIIIPKIGKNIPLVDIKQTTVSWVGELNDIFMKELENGVIRYPGSAKPGNDGNSFIFGHSSNFPWLEWDYNDVFSLLDHVTYDDEVVVYYGQEKHTYKIKTKNVISPGDVSVLKNDDKDKSKLTLMTCWPIGTTLNRLVLTGELISVE